MEKTRTTISSIKSRKRKISDASNSPPSPDSSTDTMHPAKGSRLSADEQHPTTAPKVAKLAELVATAKTSRASSIDDLAGVNPLSTELADHDIGGLLDNVDFDSDTFDFQSQGGVSSNSVPGSVPDSIPDVNELLGEEICFEEGFEAEIDEASKYSLDLKCWKRCTVLTVDRDPTTFDLVMTLREDVANGALAKCRLQGPWSSSKVSPNDLVSVLAEWNNVLNCYCVTLNVGYFILFPDTLVSGTTVTGAVFCKRKSVLSERYPGIDANNKIMFVGSLVHELFQACIGRPPILTTETEIRAVLRRMITSPDMLTQLYETNMEMDELHTELAHFVPKILNFISRYITGDGVTSTSASSSEEFSGKVDNIMDIEENIWVPRMGLKGKVDVTVKIRRRNKFADSEFELMPLEVKTGRSSFSSEHRGQVSIYQMMMTETGRNVKSGLLLYLREGIMKEIVVSRNDQRDLMLLRNDVAYYTTKNIQSTESRDSFKMYIRRMDTFANPELPEPINHHNACCKCPYNAICCAFISNDKNADIGPTHPIKRVMEAVSEHLPPSHVDYFVHWSGLLALEEKACRKADNDLKTIWTDTPETRERRGKTLVNMVISGKVQEEFNTFIHKFIPKPMAKESSAANETPINFTTIGFAVGDYLRVSTKVRVAIAAGRITEITESSMSLNLERNLIRMYPKSIFILDNVDSQSLIRMNLANLGALMDNRENTNRLRRIIVEHPKPEFNSAVSKTFAAEARQKLGDLNGIQQRAVARTITASDYVLIKGLPGTGKTQTLTSIIHMFMLLQKTVLITSHTHSAVDNVLRRLIPMNLRFLRIGDSSKVADEIKPFCTSTLVKHCRTPDDIRKLFASFPIVGVTCLGATHPILSQREFDVCLVDESTQILQTTVMRPLFSAKKFVLVGDPDQLAPIVKSSEARALGADESLFARLDHPDSTVVLTKQYRMNRTITRLANDLTYNGALQCGTISVSSATLHIPDPMKICEHFSSHKWLQKALSTQIDNSVILFDTKNVYDRSVAFQNGLPKGEAVGASSEPLERPNRIYRNYCETAITVFILRALLKSSVDPDTVGIIAPFVSQVKLLTKAIRLLERECKSKSPFEVNTVDQYQGRDKDIVIFSCTKSSKLSEGESSSDKSREFEILEDLRRLTVAITRSKHKLIIIGDVDSLREYKPFQRLFASVTEMGRTAVTDDRNGFEWEPIMDQLSQILRGTD